MRTMHGLSGLRTGRSAVVECGSTSTNTSPCWRCRTSRKGEGDGVHRRPGDALRVAALLATAVLLFSLVPRSSAAKVAKWNQERVTKIATQLAEAADNVYDKIFKLQPPAPGAAGYHSFYRLKDNVRVIKNSADYLATRLQKGGGHDETYPTFRRMMSLIRDAQENSRRVGIIPDDTMGAITHAGDLVRQLRPYYEDTSMKKGERGGTERG